MNYYTDIFLKYRGNRDKVFNFSLDFLKPNAAQILEIGVARNLSRASRCSDGWSSMHFAQYVSLYGGKLHLVDISKESMDSCVHLIASVPNFSSFETHIMAGQDFLKKSDQIFDLVLLDGPDDPNDMVESFNLIKNKTKYILCDDFHAKGVRLKEIDKTFALFYFSDYDHKMALYDTQKDLSHIRIDLPHVERENPA